MPLPNGAVGGPCHRQLVSASDDRPKVRRSPNWIANTAGLVEHLQRPDMVDLPQAGAVLVEGWIAA